MSPEALPQSNDPDASSKPRNGSPSLYSLRTIPIASASHSPTSPRLEELTHGSNETSSLLSGSGNQRSYTGLAKYMPALDPDARKLVFRAGLKVLLLFIVGSIVLGGTLWVALPTLDEADRPMLRIPKSFAQLQDLNTLLKKYRDVYPYRIFVCYTITYLYLQAFSLPGSMYLSILGGAVWGVPRALPLACSCVATGATLCYLISAALGPALLAVPSWRARLDAWSEKIEAQRDNLMSYLIVIRIAPFPPHWVVNVLCPHVGIGIPRFWISTFLGIMGVSVIHTTIGGKSNFAPLFHFFFLPMGMGCRDGRIRQTERFVDLAMGLFRLLDPPYFEIVVFWPINRVGLISLGYTA
ncbi:SNARE associated protein [Rhizoctonia solani 123E]|uniref:SNARE associated protein n=1 Tax=Rhizoctonia solani 123E TaxID=1423351 RepID=A0A074S075_9AGAM|nr:SNARE associated protein [Rhizoctonia solani 123E]